MDHERILHILDFLTRSTNENKSVTVREIQAHLAANCQLRDVSALTIRRDIDRMVTAGYDIVTERGAHNTARYSLQSRGFTFNEIRFIVDSVSINKFLSDQQKQKLIKKFEVLCSEDEVRQLVSRITLNSRNTPSLDLLDNLDKVHSIIAQKRKINFEYGKFDTNGNMQYYSKSREMLPCKVIYFSERFYLRCINEANGEVRTYRIDRMRKITAGEKSRRKAALPKPEGVDLDMFRPERYESVTLRVKRFLLDDMLEQFGNAAAVTADPAPDWIRVRAKIGISNSFLHWVMGYSENIELLAPESLRTQIAEILQKTLTMYEERRACGV